MTRILLLAILLVASVQLSAKKHPIRWKVDTTHIDGNISDWKRSIAYYDGASKIRYGLRNDSNNLYIAFYITEQAMKMKATNAGIECKFKYKNEAKRKPEIFIHPLSKRAMGQGQGQGAGRGRGQGQRPSLEDMRAYYQLNKPPVELSGFSSCNGNVYSMQHERPIEYGFDWDEQGGIVMEIKIPFTQFYGKNFRFEDLEGAAMSINITLKAMEMPDRMDSGGGGMNPQQGMGRGQGGMRPGGGGGNISKMFEAQFFSKKFLFATKPE